MPIRNLLTNVTSNQSGPDVVWEGKGSLGSIQIFGNWSGATVTIDASLDGGINFSQVQNGRFRSNKFGNIEMGDCIIRATVSDADSGTNLNAILSKSDK